MSLTARSLLPLPEPMGQRPGEGSFVTTPLPSGEDYLTKQECWLVTWLRKSSQDANAAKAQRGWLPPCPHQKNCGDD